MRYHWNVVNSEDIIPFEVGGFIADLANGKFEHLTGVMIDGKIIS